MRARHVSRHPAKFSGHMHSGSGNMVLVCHKVSQDHVIKELGDIMVGNPSWSVYRVNV